MQGISFLSGGWNNQGKKWINTTVEEPNILCPKKI
jgi:hypothetical protein